MTATYEPAPNDITKERLVATHSCLGEIENVLGFAMLRGDDERESIDALRMVQNVIERMVRGMP